MAAKFLNGIDVNSQRILAVASPSASTDAVNKAYVDSALDGLRWKIPVRAASTANAALATAYENGDTLDGVALATGDRILLKDQTTQTENGIYTVNVSGAPTRASDSDSTAELHSATVFVTSGTVNADRAYTQTTDNPTVGSSNLVFVQFGGGATYTADGNGIELTGTVFSLELDGSSLSKSGTGLKIGAAAAGAGLTETAGVLDVVAGTGITVAANSVGIDTSVVSRKNAANCTTSNPWVQAHGFGNADIIVQIVEVSTGAIVYADVVVDATNITVTLPSAPTAAQYRLVWRG